jgi:hypothetical protein
LLPSWPPYTVEYCNFRIVCGAGATAKNSESYMLPSGATSQTSSLTAPLDCPRVGNIVVTQTRLLTSWRFPIPPWRESGVFARKTTAGRLFGLDAGDWSMLLLGFALAGSLVVLV